MIITSISSIVVFVEGDAKTESVEMVVKPFMTFRELKYEAFKLVHIPMYLQKWIINDLTPEQDRQYLKEFNVNPFNFNTFFLMKDGQEQTQEISSFVEVEDFNNNNKAGATMKEPKFEDLLKLSSRPLVCNVDCFNCSICYTDIDPGDGVVLRSCLHSFCKDCIINTVKFSEEINVNCPFTDNNYKCQEFLQEREIKSLLSTELWEKHLEKSIRVAQGSIENVFYCKTPNCKGWCVLEDNINEFPCPVCNKNNCILCRAIHPGYTCRQYQDVVTGGDTETKAELGRMVSSGEAMHCPKCKVCTFE